jgi:hypothetical protein
MVQIRTGMYLIPGCMNKMVKIQLNQFKIVPYRDLQKISGTKSIKHERKCKNYSSKLEQIDKMDYINKVALSPFTCRCLLSKASDNISILSVLQVIQSPLVAVLPFIRGHMYVKVNGM